MGEYRQFLLAWSTTLPSSFKYLNASRIAMYVPGTQAFLSSLNFGPFCVFSVDS